MQSTWQLKLKQTVCQYAGGAVSFDPLQLLLKPGEEAIAFPCRSQCLPTIEYVIFKACFGTLVHIIPLFLRGVAHS